MKVVAIIQARLGSTRLPAKVLKPLLGRPMIEHVMERVGRASRLSETILATTDLERDNPLAELAGSRGWPCYRGSEEDVLDRYYQAALAARTDLVVRITSDCPLMDPGLIDEAVKRFQDALPEADYLCNWLPERTYPRGLELEVLTFEALERVWSEDHNKLWREHVTSYIDYRRELFRIHGMMYGRDVSHFRWTVDEPSDFLLVERLYDHFGQNDFAWTDVLELVEATPALREINADVKQKAWPVSAEEWEEK